jgi:hypothetical protein
MKNATLIILSLFLSGIGFSQTAGPKKSAYKSIGVAFLTYVKPQRYQLFSPFQGADFLKDVKNNIGFSVTYSQLNFKNNSGIEYGIGGDLILINNEYNFNYQDSLTNFQEVKLTPYRTKVVTISAPVFYVHKFQISERLTFFSKTGLTTRLLIDGERIGLGRSTNSENLAYELAYTTAHAHGGISFPNFLYTGTAGGSLNWKMDNGNMISFDFLLNIQLFRNTILAEINSVVYEKDGVNVLDSDNYLPDHYIDSNGNVIVNETSLGSNLSKHSLTNLSIGISYKFMKH